MCQVWAAPPVPVFMQFYVFNVTNPDAIKAGVKPSVEEIGPFTYREHREKRHIQRRGGDQVEYGLNTVYE